MNTLGGLLSRPSTSSLQHQRLFLLVAVSLISLGILAAINQNLLLDPALLTLIVETLSDAYLAVSVFVALSLLIIYAAQRFMGADLIGYLNRHPALQVPIASLLGILPGCGGAIIIVTQYVHGNVSFGALVAVLISTMGDASFLLVAREPQTAALVFAVSTSAGILFGYLIERIHGADFLKPERPADSPQAESSCRQQQKNDAPEWLLHSWRVLLIPGVILGFLAAFQVDTDSLFGSFAQYQPSLWLGFAGAVLSMLIWLRQPPSYSWSSNRENDQSLFYTVANETSFVSAWVIAGFLCFELVVYATGLDLQSMFAGLGYMTILLAVLVGFVPGCGPQIIVTTMYLQGYVPLSAQLANAISNDGDALFPAMALAPKASLYATLYSAIPALIIGYIAFGMGY